MPPRIVIDNNVLVSAALKRGGPPDILYIVSGDHHLLDLRRYGRVRIVTVTHFLRVLERLKRWQ